MTSFLPGASSGHPFQPQHTLGRVAHTSPSTRLQGSLLVSQIGSGAGNPSNCSSVHSTPALCLQPAEGALAHPFCNHGFVYAEAGRQRLIMGELGLHISFPPSITNLCPATAASVIFLISLTWDKPKHSSAELLRTNWDLETCSHTWWKH